MIATSKNSMFARVLVPEKADPTELLPVYSSSLSSFDWLYSLSAVSYSKLGKSKGKATILL